MPGHLRMHSSKKILSRLLVITLISTLVACGSLQEKREQSFYDTLTLFKHALRWESPESQLAFFINPESANLPSRYGMRAVEMDQLTPPVEIEENIWVIKVRLQYLKESSQSIRTIDDRQQWHWLGEDDGWRRNNPMPTVLRR
ncbi:hypothetical protein BOW19_08895 [Solemya velum gill symbiont]|nr:hypothetical protein BOW19_08895 [Solemya velum gill symbiont]